MIDISILKWPENAEKGRDITDLIKENQGIFPEILSKQEWIPCEKVLAGSDPKEGWTKLYPDLFKTEYEYIFYSKAGPVKITNCTFRMERVLKTDEGITYSLRACFGNEMSPVIDMPGSLVTDARGFGKHLAKMLGAEWQLWDNCPNDAIKKICIYESSRPHCLKIIRIIGYGYHAEKKMYAMPDEIIHKGMVYRPNEHDVFTIEGVNYVVHSHEDKPIAARIYGNSADSAIRYPDRIESAEELEQISQYLQHNCIRLIGKVGEYGGLLQLAWFLSTFFSDVFFDKRAGFKQSAFPFFWFTGEMESGKTTAVYLLYELFGMSLSEGMNGKTSSYAGIESPLQILHNIPLWLDEYSIESRVKADDLKMVFGRGGRIKGHMWSHRTTNYNACLMLTGQGIVPELANRALWVQFPLAEDREERNRIAHQELSRGRDETRKFGLWVMTERTRDAEGSEKKFIKEAKYLLGLFADRLASQGERERANLAYALASLAILPKPIAIVEEWLNTHKGPFWEWLFRWTHATADLRRSEDIIHLGISLYLSEPGSVIISKMKRDSPPIIAIPYRRLVKLQKINSFQFENFKQRLRSEPYTLDNGLTKVIKVPNTDNTNWVDNGHRLLGESCIQLDGSHPRLPAIIRDNAYHFLENRWQKMSDFSDTEDL